MNVPINYAELAFILKTPTVVTKSFFKNELAIDKVTLKDFIMSDSLHGKFGVIKSVDQRYEGADKFEFYLNQCKMSYRNFVNEKEFVKAKQFKGGKSIFYKILTNQELEQIQKSVDEKHLIVYGKNKHDNKQQSL
jgi:hypothetical protein